MNEYILFLKQLLSGLNDFKEIFYPDKIMVWYEKVTHIENDLFASEIHKVRSVPRRVRIELMVYREFCLASRREELEQRNRLIISIENAIDYLEGLP